jgi:Tol biopolymer transport system component
VNISPAWSPDGTQIAYVGDGARIYLMPNIPGAEAQPFSRSGAKENAYPAWSIDGSFVIFSQKPTDGSFVSNVYLLSLEMLGVTDTTKYSEVRISSKNEPEANPQYSSDGQWIVIESWPDGENHDIFIMLADGSQKQAIGSDPALDFDPTWRP